MTHSRRVANNDANLLFLQGHAPLEVHRRLRRLEPLLSFIIESPPSPLSWPTQKGPRAINTPRPQSQRNTTSSLYYDYVDLPTPNYLLSPAAVPQHPDVGALGPLGERGLQADAAVVELLGGLPQHE
eukprot:6716490-Pyramimonas_sp.AAC.1